MELSIEQECALQQYEDGDNLFITGEGGTGKTTLIQHLITSAYRRKKRLQICAMTGCAALLLNCGAKTIHSWSGIRLAKGSMENVVHSVIYSKRAVQNWKALDILVIDEVSMMSKRIFDILNEIGKRTRRNSKPFGGIQVIFCGDFYQLPPVCGSEEAESELFCFESKEWYETFPYDNHIVLNTIFRQTDVKYKEILSGIRKGNIQKEGMELLRSRVNCPFDLEKHNGCVPTKLYPTRSKVDYVNKTMFDKLEGQSYEYDFISKSNCRYNLETNVAIPLFELQKCRKLLDETKITNETNTLINSSPCVRTLQLKKGTNVMCTVNLDMENGICNGSTGVVIDFVVHSGIPFPIVQFSNGLKREIQMKYWQSEEYPVVAIGQLPLCHAWAMTIHKIQGATLSMAEMDIGNGIFECGQTYVALSRVKSLDGLYLTSFDPSKIRINPKVKEFYEQIPEVEYESVNESVNESAVDESVNESAVAESETSDLKTVSINQELSFESYAYSDDSTTVKKVSL